jgi:hypothetical protein
MVAAHVNNDHQHYPPRNSEYLTHPKYRADIDGLRAIAIISVVGFHAFPNWVTGGFIGVDIFFVISGYLISTIIFGSLAHNSFSFVEFYSRRIKRIFPALLLVLISSFAVGWFVLLSDEYKQLGKHIAGGAGFVSNFMFWSESGYFDNAAETKPLLHIWSLGVEEQYYIIWPPLLWFAWKLRFNLLTITIVVAAISFALNVAKVNGGDAVAAFYSPQTRFWELLVGSALAYITLHKQNILPKSKLMPDTWLGQIQKIQAPEANGKTMRNVQSVFGAVLIAIGVLIITRERTFPGWWAVLPTVGTVLIILAGKQAWLNRAVLSNRVLVWFGLISYPVYLWHWPLLSFARIVESETPSSDIRIAAVLISIALAWLTYRLIEKPIRFGSHSKVKTIILLVLMVAIGCVGYNCYKMDGFGFRLNERQEYSNYFENNHNEFRYGKKVGLLEKYRFECNFFDMEKYMKGQETQVPRDGISKNCFERSGAYSNALFVWGDSHAQHLYFGLKNNLPPSWQILQVASTNCAPDVNVKEPSSTDQCAQSNWFALETIKETKPNVVIVAQNSGHNIKSFNEIAEKLKSAGINKIIFAGPTPHWTSDLPKIILKQLWKNTPRRTFKGINLNVFINNSVLQKNFKQSDTVIYANLIDFFCNNDGCLTYIGDDKKTGITAWDYGHLSPVASDYLAKNLLVNLIVGNEVKTQQPSN